MLNNPQLKLRLIMSKMSETLPKKTHFRHFRLHVFYQGLNPKVAAINLRDLYGYEDPNVY